MCDKKNDNSENNDKEKEPVCLNDTFPNEMEEGVSDKKNDKSENNDERKEAECLDNKKITKMKNTMMEKMKMKK